MGEDEKSKNTIHFFFRCVGVSVVILSIKTNVIGNPSIQTVKALWYTFLYVFMEAIWFGLAAMFIIDLYKYIKSKLL